MAYSQHSPQEVEALGENIYQSQIREKLSQEDCGKFVVIDVGSGDYEIAATDLQATRALLKKCPQAVTYGIRVGYDAAYTLGGHMQDVLVTQTTGASLIGMELLEGSRLSMDVRDGGSLTIEELPNSQP